MPFVFTKIDNEKSTQGVWVEHHDGSCHLLARSGTNQQQRIYQETLKRYRKKDHEDLPLDKRQEFFCRVLSKAIVLDWRDFKDIEGTPVPYSEQNAFDYLMASNDYLEWVSNESATEEHFYRERVADAKNS